jgi:protease-4
MAKKEGGSGLVTFFKVTGAVIGALISLLFLLFALVIFIAVFVPSEDLVGGNVAVIPITGAISLGDNGDLLEDSGTPADDIIDWIQEADEDAETRAIILKIDSPGGSPVATDEIARAVKNVNKTVVAVIREEGASGAFWIATAADYVIANRMSMTGSIGVVGSHLEFAGLLDDYNVTYRRLVAGKHKDAGSRWKEMTPEEQALYQKLLDQIHTEFIHEVAANRRLPVESVRKIAHGFVLTGAEAKELGLVDALGNEDDAVTYIEQSLGITAELYEFEPQKKFFEDLLGLSSYNIGRGIGTSLITGTQTDSVKVIT